MTGWGSTWSLTPCFGIWSSPGSWSPTSKADAERVLADLGATTVSYRTIARHLDQAGPGKYRDAIAAKCFDYSSDCGGLSLLLYDVTTLYFGRFREVRGSWWCGVEL
jgi:hypothetical protein